MTSNVGSDLIRRESSLGFSVQTDEAKSADQQYTKMKDKVMDELKRVFRPEFLNRIDSQIVFHALSKEHIRSIVDLRMEEVARNLMLKGISMEATDAARDWLGEKGYDPIFGARPLRRVIQNEIEDRLSEALLDGRFQAADAVVIDCEGGEIILTKQETPQETPELASSS